MELTADPGELRCSACDEPIRETGYLPATEEAGGYSPSPAGAVCAGCGFNDIGMAGCAPTLDDVAGDGDAEVLLHVRVTAGGIEVLSTK